MLLKINIEHFIHRTTGQGSKETANEVLSLFVTPRYLNLSSNLTAVMRHLNFCEIKIILLKEYLSSAKTPRNRFYCAS